MRDDDARCAIAVFKELYPLIYRVARAIEWYEGGPTQFGSLPQRNNNPGNLRSSSLAWSRDAGFAVFNSYHVGFLALLLDLRAKAQGKTATGLGPTSTIEELMHVYAPSFENATEAYLRFVESRTDLPASTRLGDLL